MEQPELTPGSRVLVEGVEVRAEGELVSADPAIIVIRDPRDDDAEYEISWADIRKISVRVGKEGTRWTPGLLALLCGGFFGACGLVLDELDRSTSGYSHSYVTFIGIPVGALAGWGLGRLIRRAAGSPWWLPIYRVPDGVEPPTEQPLEARLAAGAISEDEQLTHAGKQSMKTGFAWVMLLALFFGAVAVCRG